MGIRSNVGFASCLPAAGIHHARFMSLAPTAAVPRALRMRYGPAGVHLFDRASGVNLLLDELPVPPELWSLAPRQVSIALTNACDLDCPYCYAPKTRHLLN